MAFVLENSQHSQDLQSVLTGWSTQYDQHDLLLICNSGHRVTTKQSLLSLHSPLIRTLLDNIPPSAVTPAVTVEADIRAVSGLICLLITGKVTSGKRTELKEVELLAKSLGVTLTNCEMVDNNARRTIVVGTKKTVSITPMGTSVNKIERTIPSLGKGVEIKSVPNDIAILKKRGINISSSKVKTEESSLKKRGLSISTTTVKTDEAIGISKEIFLPASIKIEPIIEKLRNAAEKQVIGKNVSTNELRYTCKICKKSFADKRGLKRHRRQKHKVKIVGESLNEYVQIPSTSESYSEEQEIDDDLSTNDQRYACQMCDKSFSDNSCLNRHIKQKHGDTFADESQNEDIPNSSTTEYYSEQQEIDNDSSTNELRYACQMCDKSFADKRGLKRHISQKHESESLEEDYLDMVVVKQEVPVTDKADKAFSCNDCGKLFTCGSSLRNHVNIHLEDKPFKCTICEKQFAQKGNMKTHMSKYHPDVEYAVDGDESLGNYIDESNVSNGELEVTTEELGDVEIAN